MEEAGDSAPPVEEEAPAPAPAPETPRTPPPVPHLTLVFVGLDGAGKTAVIRALGKDGEGERKSVSDEGALCAPPTTVAVTIHAGLRACGVSLDVVDVPGRGVVAGNARHVAWRRHLDALVTPEDEADDGLRAAHAQLLQWCQLQRPIATHTSTQTTAANDPREALV